MKIKLSDIKPNPENPRTIKDDNFNKLVNSLKDFPVMTSLREVVLDENSVIIGGNMRYRAAKEAGWKEIEAKIFTRELAELNNKLTGQDKTYEEYCEEFVIKDNISGGDWDWDILANKWDAEDLDKWGLELPGDYKEEPEIEEDEAPEVSSEPPVSELGKIYQLGRHRLMCGDSTDKANVELLMNGEKADMVFTDPPYGMYYEADWSTAEGEIGGRKSKGKKYDNVIGDHQDYDPAHIFDIFGYCKEIFLWGADYYAERIPAKNAGSWLVWDKTLTESADKGFGSNFELCWSKNRHKREIARIKWQGFFGLQADDTKTRVHPTQKPAELARFVIDKWADKLNLVVDLFLGSGSTLIACEQTDRICYGMELDPKYVDVIRKRYAKFIQPDNQLPENWEELTPEIN